RGNVLSANEVAQILRSTADDIDFATPNHVDKANDMVDDFGQKRFPSVKGWDATHGYGRINAYEAARSAAAGNIPPEADITSPKWFAMESTSGTLAVEGRVAAVRSTAYSYRVEWTTGLQTDPYPASDDWHTAIERSGLAAPVQGELAELDLATIAAALPDGGAGAPIGSNGLPDPDRFTVRVRVVVTDAEGRVGTMHRHFMVHSDPDSAQVVTLPGTGMSSPVFHDLTGDGADELVIGADDGQVHVLDPAGNEIPGFPVRTTAAGYWHEQSPSARANGIEAPGDAVPVGAPAIADLNGDGVDEIVVTDTGGGVTWWDASGRVVGSARTDPRFSLGENTDKWNREKPGILGSAALGDLDGDGTLEIVVAAMDRHVYAWHADSTPVSGFPVMLVDPAKVKEVDPASHRVTFRSPSTTGIGGELIATPAIADLTGDGRPEIVVGAQEQYDEPLAVFPAIGLPGTSGNTRLYAISPEGRNAAGRDRSPAHPDDNAYLSGWPVKLPMLLMDVLPTIGGGVATQVAVGDVDGDKLPEVVAASASGQIKVFNPDGSSPYGAFGLPVGLNWLGAVGPGSNSRDTGLLVSAFGGPSIGRIGSLTSLDIASTTSGLGRALDTLFTNKQAGDPHLTVWNGRDGSVRSGFPRVSADIAFFVTPAIVDVDGDGRNEAVAGNGMQMIQAESVGGRTPAGWPKFTGGWVVGTTGSGDWDGDGNAELAAVRRDGVLLVWRTPTDATALGDWVRFGGNTRNDGTGSR
ncbi:MAG TPA: VCBS repeat-containing protein, partial [Microthrixaceae bacterium]|nr:VCBS repeat-containing protein [Microthrixaceae bacterium]